MQQNTEISESTIKSVPKLGLLELIDGCFEFEYPFLRLALIFPNKKHNQSESDRKHSDEQKLLLFKPAILDIENLLLLI